MWIAIELFPSALVCRDLFKNILGQPVDPKFVFVGDRSVSIGEPSTYDFNLKCL